MDCFSIVEHTLVLTLSRIDRKGIFVVNGELARIVDRRLSCVVVRKLLYLSGRRRIL
jgi:hypothetical protein